MHLPDIVVPHKLTGWRIYLTQDEIDATPFTFWVFPM